MGKVTKVVSVENIPASNAVDKSMLLSLSSNFLSSLAYFTPSFKPFAARPVHNGVLLGKLPSSTYRCCVKSLFRPDVEYKNSAASLPTAAKIPSHF